MEPESTISYTWNLASWAWNLSQLTSCTEGKKFLNLSVGPFCVPLQSLECSTISLRGKSLKQYMHLSRGSAPAFLASPPSPRLSLQTEEWRTSSSSGNRARQCTQCSVTSDYITGHWYITKPGAQCSGTLDYYNGALMMLTNRKRTGPSLRAL